MSFLNEGGPCPSFLKVHTLSQWFEVCDDRESKESKMVWLYTDEFVAVSDYVAPPTYVAER